MKRLLLLVLIATAALTEYSAAQVTARCRVTPKPGQTCGDAINQAERQPQQPLQKSEQNQQPGQEASQQFPSRAGTMPTAGRPEFSVPSQQAPASSRQNPGSEPATALDRVLQRKLSTEVIQRLNGILGTVQPGSGRGGPNADRWFDQTEPGTTGDTVKAPARDMLLQGTLGGIQSAPPETAHMFNPITPDTALAIQHDYGTVPGGVVLEGAPTDLGPIHRVEYDGKYNAFVLDDRAVYFSPVAAGSIAVLARSIAQDDRVGVSLGQVQIVYGAVPENSNVALDLKLADQFLGDIVFAQRRWTAGYRFANGYEPEKETGDFDLAVFFKFTGFDFRIVDEQVQLISQGFDVTLVPLTKAKSADGGHLPDLEAIARGESYPHYERNARHVSDNIDYYQKEIIVQQMFAYGEVAAFLRGLKSAGVNLRAVADAIEWSTGIQPVAGRVMTPDVAEMRKPIDNLFDAWRRLDLAEYLTQWAPDVVKYEKDQRTEFVDIQRSREELFPQISASAVAYSPVYRGFSNGVAQFDSIYEMALRFQDGRIFHETACESYKTALRGGHWLIIENRDYRPCDEINQSIQSEYQQRARRLESEWAEYLKQIQAHNAYPNWSGPPYDLYLASNRSSDSATDAASGSYVSRDNRDLIGVDLRTLKNIELDDCVSACQREADCQGYSFDKWNRYCFLKTNLSALILDPKSLSGVRQNLQMPPTSDVEATMVHYRGKKFPGSGYKSIANSIYENCEMTCQNELACVAFSFDKQSLVCKLFNSTGVYVLNALSDSGAKIQPR